MHLSKGLWELRQFARQIWTRIALISALALISGACAPLLSPLLPEGLKDRLDAGATANLLDILSSSMLTVATFSLSVMVAAHHYAASQVTPRSHRLLRQDTRTQTVLATFIGAFVYALVSIILLNAGVYSPRDLVVVYGFTILVIVLVIIAIVRWIQHLSGLGSMEQTTSRVEAIVTQSLALRMDTPCLGGTPLDDRTDIPATAASVDALSFGFVQYVDADALSEAARRLDGDIFVLAVPGLWVTPGDTLLRVAVGRIDEGETARLRESIVIGASRSFDQDPQFGVQVMAEIAQRALSPGLNDPRTATDIILRQLRILHAWRDERASCDRDAEISFPRVHVPTMVALDLMREAFDHIARDGAAMVEVHLHLQHALSVLARHDNDEMRQAARTIARRALVYSDEGLVLEADRDLVRAASPVRDGPEPPTSVN